MSILNVLKKAGVDAKLVEPKRNSKNNIPASYHEALLSNIDKGLEWLEKNKLNDKTPVVHEMNMANYVDAEGNRVIFLISKSGIKLFESKEEAMFQKGWEVSNSKEAIRNSLNGLKDHFKGKEDKDLYDMWVKHSFARLDDDGNHMVHESKRTKTGKPQKLYNSKIVQIKDIYS